jgi:hypothetical protein
MAGLVPAIHVLFSPNRKDVDARHTAGQDELDEEDQWRPTNCCFTPATALAPK